MLAVAPKLNINKAFVGQQEDELERFVAQLDPTGGPAKVRRHQPSHLGVQHMDQVLNSFPHRHGIQPSEHPYPSVIGRFSSTQSWNRESQRNVTPVFFPPPGSMLRAPHSGSSSHGDGHAAKLLEANLLNGRPSHLGGGPLGEAKSFKGDDDLHGAAPGASQQLSPTSILEEVDAMLASAGPRASTAQSKASSNGRSAATAQQLRSFSSIPSLLPPDGDKILRLDEEGERNGEREGVDGWLTAGRTDSENEHLAGRYLRRKSSPHPAKLAAEVRQSLTGRDMMAAADAAVATSRGSDASNDDIEQQLNASLRIHSTTSRPGSPHPIRVRQKSISVRVDADQVPGDGDSDSSGDSLTKSMRATSRILSTSAAPWRTWPPSPPHPGALSTSQSHRADTVLKLDDDGEGARPSTARPPSPHPLRVLSMRPRDMESAAAGAMGMSHLSDDGHTHRPSSPHPVGRLRSYRLQESMRSVRMADDEKEDEEESSDEDGTSVGDGDSLARTMRSMSRLPLDPEQQAKLAALRARDEAEEAAQEEAERSGEGNLNDSMRQSSHIERSQPEPVDRMLSLRARNASPHPSKLASSVRRSVGITLPDGEEAEDDADLRPGTAQRPGTAAESAAALADKEDIGGAMQWAVSGSAADRNSPGGQRQIKSWRSSIFDMKPLSTPPHDGEANRPEGGTTASFNPAMRLSLHSRPGTAGLPGSMHGDIMSPERPGTAALVVPKNVDIDKLDGVKRTNSHRPGTGEKGNLPAAGGADVPSKGSRRRLGPDIPLGGLLDASNWPTGPLPEPPKDEGGSVFLPSPLDWARQNSKVDRLVLGDRLDVMSHSDQDSAHLPDEVAVPAGSEVASTALSGLAGLGADAAGEDYDVDWNGQLTGPAGEELLAARRVSSQEQKDQLMQRFIHDAADTVILSHGASDLMVNAAKDAVEKVDNSRRGGTPVRMTLPGAMIDTELQPSDLQAAQDSEPTKQPDIWNASLPAGRRLWSPMGFERNTGPVAWRTAALLSKMASPLASQQPARQTESPERAPLRARAPREGNWRLSWWPSANRNHNRVAAAVALPPESDAWRMASRANEPIGIAMAGRPYSPTKVPPRTPNGRQHPPGSPDRRGRARSTMPGGFI